MQCQFHSEIIGLISLSFDMCRHLLRLQISGNEQNQERVMKRKKREACINCRGEEAEKVGEET